MRLRMGVDLDGCVYDWDGEAKFLLEHEFGYELPEHTTEWSQLEKLVEPEHWKWLWDEGIERGLFRYGKLHEGALEAMRDLAKMVHIVVLTSRPPQARVDTLAWLAHYRIVVDELHVLGQSGITGKSRRKSEVACDVYLDDAPHNLKELIENTKSKVVGFKRPWNAVPELRENDALYWAETWPEVVELVRRFASDARRK